MIDRFEQLLKENVYSQRDLDNSVALVSTRANDYPFYFTAKKGSRDGLPAFTEGLVNQLAADLQRINRLGVKKVVAATLPLLGCLPIHIIPPNTYQNCDEEYNKNAKIHNQLLQKAVEKLNTDDGNKSTFVILDLYNAWFLLLTNSDRMQQTLRARTHCSHVARRVLSTYAQRKDYARVPSHLSFLIWHTLRTMAPGMLFIHFCKVLLTKI